MAEKSFKTETEHDTLSWVREGMPVFDDIDHKIGTVKYVQFADGSADALAAKPAEFYHLPPEVQVRLAHHGFVQIDCGFLARDRFALPEQIMQLSDDGLKLNVTGESLIKA